MDICLFTNHFPVSELKIMLISVNDRFGFANNLDCCLQIPKNSSKPLEILSLWRIFNQEISWKEK
jgi:hypothetical protein